MAIYNYPYPSYDWQYQGIDFAYIPVTQALANQMYQDGIRIVGRYLYASRYPNGKGISAQEAQYYLDAGIALFFYYEVDTSDALNGYSRGATNGQACLTECWDLNVPQGTQIYCACDTSVTDAQATGVVMDYLHGFSDQLPNYHTGIYGGQNVMNACYSVYPANYRCQAGAWGNQEFEPINVRQWLISNNNRALSDGKIRIDNITIDSNGYASWRGYNVDLVSANRIANMWYSGSPVPPTPEPSSKMPIWFYLKRPL